MISRTADEGRKIASRQISPRRRRPLVYFLSSMTCPRRVSSEHDDAAKYRKFGEDRLRQKKSTTLNFG